MAGSQAPTSGQINLQGYWTIKHKEDGTADMKVVMHQGTIQECEPRVALLVAGFLIRYVQETSNLSNQQVQELFGEATIYGRDQNQG